MNENAQQKDAPDGFQPLVHPCRRAPTQLSQKGVSAMTDSHGAVPWIPLIQTGLWMTFALVLLVYLRRHVTEVLTAIAARLQSGAPLKVAGIIELGAPASLPTNKQGVATAEGSGGAETAPDIMTRLERREYPPGINDDLCLVHESKVLLAPTQGKPGLFRVRVHLDSCSEIGPPEDVVRVTYRLHDTFRRKVIATEARENDFELWLNVYGEIMVIGYVERREKESLWVSRYLDLPGRPTN